MERGGRRDGVNSILHHSKGRGLIKVRGGGRVGIRAERKVSCLSANRWGKLQG